MENEMKQQKMTLMKQRKDYVKKQAALRSDLEQLAKQKRELQAEKRADNEPIISKNHKLQVFFISINVLFLKNTIIKQFTGIFQPLKTFVVTSFFKVTKPINQTLSNV